MRKSILYLVVIFHFSLGNAQTITNGTFAAGGTGWGCSPETNPVSTYGGVGSNRVAEVDQAAGLCQTISGFTIGSVYQISFLCSRRTSCGPPTQSANFSISAGALPTQSISRTGAFAFTTTSYIFTATATSHTITFVGTSPGTCGLIFDDINLILISGLPIELAYFEAFPDPTGAVQIDWKTASESNNDFFTIERSTNGSDWLEIHREKGAENSTSMLHYSAIDAQPHLGLSYYRLKQTVFDGKYSYSSIKSVTLQRPDSDIRLYPNPAQREITVQGNNLEKEEIRILNTLGQDVSHQITLVKISADEIRLDLAQLSSGLYTIKTGETIKRFQKL